jgi:AcrR family transcriptional regulator
MIYSKQCYISLFYLYKERIILMAKQIEGVYEKVLECAKLEFLEKGYQEASLRNIAQNAGTSTGSIYTRFTDKSGLFDALVSSSAEGLKQKMLSAREVDRRSAEMEQKEFDSNYIGGKDYISYIYDHYDEFKLIITCSEGTVYSEYIHSLVEINVEQVVNCLKNSAKKAVSSELLHILASAYICGIFETVVHDMSKEAAYQYMEQFIQFFLCGWRTIWKD